MNFAFHSFKQVAFQHSAMARNALLPADSPFYWHAKGRNPIAISAKIQGVTRTPLLNEWPFLS